MPPLIQYWHDGEPPGYIAELIDSFRNHNPGMEHLLFDEASAEALIANRYGPRELAAFQACELPSMQADYFRYCAGHALGGICVDADCRCLGTLLPLLEGPGRGLLFRSEAGVVANGLVAFASPGHRLLELSLEIATETIERRPRAKVAQLTGPGVFTCLRCLLLSDSVAALRRWAEAGVEPAPRELRDDAVRSLLREMLAGDGGGRETLRASCIAAGDAAGVAAAFDGVRVAPGSEVLGKLIEHLGPTAPYKDSDAYRPGQGFVRFRDG